MVKVEKGPPKLEPPPGRRKAMPVPKANQRAVNKYMKNNYDRINVTMPKGKKETIQAHADAQGQSVNAYINAAIDEKMAQESVGSPIRHTASKMMLDTTSCDGNVLGPSEGRREGGA